MAAPPENPSDRLTVLHGPEREAMLARLRVVLSTPEDEVLLEDEFGQPWVDRPASDAAARELARVSWREVCCNWPDAMCSGETDRA